MLPAVEKDASHRSGKKLRSLTRLVGADAELLSAQLQELRTRAFPPSAEKELRRFTSGEAAKLIGVSDGYLRHLSLTGEMPEPEKTPSGRRLYSLGQVHEIRRHLAKTKANYLPFRRGNDHLQVIAATNFKGGSGKTTTAAHLAQYLALRGYRTLAIDLDPQASLSALFGIQPELTSRRIRHCTVQSGTMIASGRSRISSGKHISLGSILFRGTWNCKNSNTIRPRFSPTAGAAPTACFFRASHPP